ncbi:unnamed protein product [Heligmosomoides polygyrus]|uniref:MBD domain-containing protein n=1 Tax=Heligmosomoides polygyrus TaxID=6339 RepID=A0A3P7YN33_HELPZ|nr:unnamed protein product [Heligmosomoides polygyrus]
MERLPPLVGACPTDLRGFDDFTPRVVAKVAAAFAVVVVDGDDVFNDGRLYEKRWSAVELFRSVPTAWLLGDWRFPHWKPDDLCANDDDGNDYPATASFAGTAAVPAVCVYVTDRMERSGWGEVSGGLEDIAGSGWGADYGSVEGATGWITGEARENHHLKGLRRFENVTERRRRRLRRQRRRQRQRWWSFGRKRMADDDDNDWLAEHENEHDPSAASFMKALGNMNKSMLDAAMLQLLASQMMSQQAAVAKMNGSKHTNNRATKKEAAHLALDLSSKTKAEPGPSSDGTETRSSATPSDGFGVEVGKKRPPATEAQARVPLLMGWRRQTCIRSIAASGVRGDVVYYAPCGKKLSTYAEVLRYLMKNPCTTITRDNFSFSSKLIVGEFLMPKEVESGEKTVVKVSEEAVAEEVNRLVSLKPQPRNGERRHRERAERPPPPVSEGRATPEEVPEPQIHHVEVIESPVEVYDDEDKGKWSREPIDDLLLTEIRPVPDLPRVENLRLNGAGFADALMVHEFVHNFARVLDIGDVAHFEKILKLTRSLFRLVLEYPGMPAGKRGRTKLGQSVSELGVTEQNYSELMRIFLSTRDSQGEKLSKLLVDRSFAELSGEEKASILAFICNELLCCPNIVKDIDRNLEEVGRLKGDRWMRDGKARALRVVQQRKLKAERGVHCSDTDGQAPEERPSSRNSEASDTSRPATPIPTTRDRRLTPGLGQCEILTEEEESMSPDQLEGLIDSLNSEAEHLKEKINELSTKVRSFPLGCDRYHRQYWQIPGIPSVLVESIESSGLWNPACNREETCSKDPPELTAPTFLHPDVFACVEDLVDDVVTGRSHTERRKRKRFRRMDNPYKRGWWSVDTREALESVRSSLHGRGIRERILHRLLCKPWFLKDVKLGKVELDKVGKEIGWKEVTELNRNAVHRQLDELNGKISSARIAIKGAASGFMKPGTGNGSMEELRQRIITCERRVNRNFLRPSFFVGEKKCLAYSMEMESEHMKNGDDEDDRDEAEKDEDEAEESERDESSSNTQMIDRWRAFVDTAETPAKLSPKNGGRLEIISRLEANEFFSMESRFPELKLLNSSIAWELAPSMRLCQICRKRCEQTSTTLRCTACRLNYHQGCCKSPPSREWFCPACVETSTQVPTCLVCSQQNDYLTPCRKCYHFFHLECVPDATYDPSVDFLCRGCDPKNHHHNHNHQNHSNSHHSSQSRDAKRPLKRKADAPPPLVFPTDMNNDLCRAMLDELECQPGVGPFLEPVDLDLVPGYREAIANPIDMASIRNRIEAQCRNGSVAPTSEYPKSIMVLAGLAAGGKTPLIFVESEIKQDPPTHHAKLEQKWCTDNFPGFISAERYETPDDFAADMELMFSNCRTFNEDDSPVGIAGANLQKFYHKRWRQLKYNFSKRLKRMRHAI